MKPLTTGLFYESHGVGDPKVSPFCAYHGIKQGARFTLAYFGSHEAADTWRLQHGSRHDVLDMKGMYRALAVGGQ